MYESINAISNSKFGGEKYEFENNILRKDNL